MASQDSRGGGGPGQAGGEAGQAGGEPAPGGPPAKAAPPRRLGAQGPAQAARGARSAGAARRYDRSRRGRSSWIGWASVAVVVLLVVVLVVVKLTANGSSSGPRPAAAAGRDPAAAPASLVSAITTIPGATFDSVGTDGQPAPFTVTKGQPSLASGGKPQLLYVGGEFCPYCALMRWSLIPALSRFGTFTGLKLISSASTDGDIPTYSFLGARYTSRYVDFVAYETEDRAQNPLQSPPAYVNRLYAKYDGVGTTPAAPFNPATSAGIPFLDVANKYVSSGDPNALALLFEQSGVLNNGGPGRAAIGAALRDPTSAVGKAISAKLFIAEANYITAAICSVNGDKPATVCSSSGAQAAAKVLAAAKPVS